jgi:4-amino-4-deoxy-L-arabinose transferase-like glycosyltransferase
MNPFFSNLENKKEQIYSLFILAFLIFYTKLWEGPLAGDEACYALLSRQILRTGDWLVLHHPYLEEWKNFYEHPPLYMWITALNFKLFGISDFTAKLFSATSGFASIILIYLTGRKMVNHHFGFISAFILLTTIYFIDYSRKARLEIPLLFFILLSFFFLIMCLQNRKNLWAFLSGIAAAFAFLVKGIPAFSLILLAIIGFTFYSGSLKNKVTNFATFISGVLFILVPWVYAQFLNDNGRFFDWYIYKQVGWSLSGRTSIPTGSQFSLFSFIFYPRKLLFEIMVPWAIFAILGLIEIVKRKKFRLDYLKYLVFFAALIIILSFSLVQFKKTRYVLPALPFLSLLAAEYFINRSWFNVFSRWISKAIIVITCIILLIAVLTPIPFYSKKDSKILAFSSYIENCSSKQDSLLVAGIKPYTVHQVFSWYYDRPQKIVENTEIFKKEWEKGKYKIGILKESNHLNNQIMNINERPFIKNGPYSLFISDEILNSCTINLHEEKR